MLTRIQQSIRKHALFGPGDGVVLAVSGGADSVALAEALHELFGATLRAHVAHLHHGLRGEQANQDAALVEQLAARWGWPFHLEQGDVKGLAEREGWSLEQAGREARYDWLTRVCLETGSRCIVTAHHADDQVETVLMNLLRGTGSRGMAGMNVRQQRGEVMVVRPMLNTTHAEAVQYLESRGVGWREDESNEDVSFLRNRVRRELLPLLKNKFDPKADEHILQLASLLRDESAWLDELSGNLYQERVREDGRGLDLRDWSELHPAARRAVLRRWLEGAGVGGRQADFDAVERLGRACGRTEGSEEVSMGGPVKVVRRYAMLHALSPGAGGEPFSVEIAAPGETMLREQGLRVVIREARGPGEKRRGVLGALPARARIGHVAGVDHPLVVRSWRPGDAIEPMGMTGSKKLHDLFIDEKVPRDRRGALPLLACRETIVWVPGYSVARGWGVEHEQAPSWEVQIESC